MPGASSKPGNVGPSTSEEIFRPILSAIPGPVLAAVLFVLLGAYTITIQIVLVRECFALFTGNELSVAVQLALWLACTALGGIAGSAMVGRRLPVLLLGLPVAGAAAPLLVRLLPLVLPLAAGETVPVTWAILSLVLAQLPLNLIAGALFPVACDRLCRRGDATAIGRCYLFEALGAALAGLLVTCLLAGPVRDLDLALLSSACISLAAATIGGNLHRSRLVPALAACMAAILAGVGLLTRPAQLLDTWWWQQHQPGSIRLATIESRYQRIDLALRQGQRTVYCNGLPAVTLEDTDEPSSGYRLADLYLGLHPDPHRVLVVGQGEPGLVRRMLEHRLSELHYLLLDPALLAAISAGEQQTIWSDPRLVLLAVDGRRFLRTTGLRFDVIVFDQPAPITAAGNRFFTTEAFAAAAEKALAENGLLTFRLPSSAHFIGGETEMVLASVARALQQAFPSWQLLAGDSMVFAAGTGVTLPSLDDLTQRLAARPVPLYLPAGRALRETAAKAAAYQALLADYFDPYRSGWQQQALSLAQVPANSDAHPIAYAFNLQRWLRETGIDSGMLDRILETASGTVSLLRRHWQLATLLATLLTASVSVRLRRRGNQPLLAIAVLTSGWAGMLGELAIIFTYQSRFGQLYSAIGALFGLYMLGLVAGSCLTLQRPAGRRSLPALVVLRLLMVISCLGVGVLCAGDSGGIGRTFFAAVFVYALVLGAEYPIANRLLCRETGRRRAAGLLHAMDHLGAAAATLLGGTLLLPLAGATSLLHALACLHLVVLVPLSLSSRVRRRWPDSCVAG